MGPWGEPWIFFDIMTFRKKNPRSPEMNHPFCLLQKKRHQNWLWDGRLARPLTALSDRSYTGQPLCKFSLDVIAFWSHVAAAALNHGSFPCNPKGWNNLPFDEDFIVALTAMNHGGRGSASLIGALQVRMHQRDMNCMKSKATNAIYATLYSEGNFRVLFTQWHESSVGSNMTSQKKIICHNLAIIPAGC